MLEREREEFIKIMEVWNGMGWKGPQVSYAEGGKKSVVYIILYLFIWITNSV